MPLISNVRDHRSMPNALRSSLIAVAVLWIGATLVVTAMEYVQERQGYFVQRVLPVGTSWQGHQIAIPGPPPITITITEEERLCRNEKFAELDRKDGERILHPQESPWACIKSLPVLMAIRWPQFCLALVVGLSLLLLGAVPRHSRSTSKRSEQ